MNIAEVLKNLQEDNGFFSRKAAREAMQHREEITPVLIELLRYTRERAEELTENDTDSMFFLRLYGLFLLAQFREPRAYPAIAELFRLREELLDELFADFVGEELPGVLASVCNGDTSLIEGLVEDPSVSPAVRGAGIRSFLVLVAAGDKTRDEVIAYYKALFEGRLDRRPSEAWDDLVVCSIYLYPEEVRGHIEEAQKQGLLQALHTPFKRLELALAQDRQTVLEHLPRNLPVYVANAMDEVEAWTCFDTPPLPDDTGPVRLDVESLFLKTLFPEYWERPWELDGYSSPPEDDFMDDEFGEYDDIDYVPGDLDRLPFSLAAPTQSAKVGPNDPCPCGSGKKFKKCCGNMA